VTDEEDARWRVLKTGLCKKLITTWIVKSLLSLHSFKWKSAL